MAIENGEWIMRGMDPEDPACIQNWEELIGWVDEVGFLPLFKNEADGFSVTVKGENGTYRLAIWQRGGYSYSLSLEKGADAAAFLKIAEENQ